MLNKGKKNIFVHLQIDKKLKTWKEKNYGISGSVCKSATWFGEIKKLVFPDIAPVAEITIILLLLHSRAKRGMRMISFLMQ